MDIITDFVFFMLLCNFRQTLGSPQFQQAMGSFQAALQSGQLGPLMGQFGMPSEVSNAAAQVRLGLSVFHSLIQVIESVC